MIDFSTVKEGDRVNYIGDSLAYGGVYKVYKAEDTYIPDKCPEDEKGTLLIVELMNNDSPMFFKFSKLNPTDWELMSWS